MLSLTNLASMPPQYCKGNVEKATGPSISAMLTRGSGTGRATSLRQEIANFYIGATLA